jgi:hypothetical protein
MGHDNTADGMNALLINTTGQFNTAVGLGALQHNTIGESNTAIGSTALNNNSSGSSNIALGSDAGHNLTTGDDNIVIGNLAVAGESGAIRIGTSGVQVKTFVAGISGVAVTGATVLVSSSGQLGVAASSARFKKDIQSMDKASEGLLALRPVTFRYKDEIDPQGVPQFGLIAEDVAKVNPALVSRDAKGNTFTVRYDAVNAMLLNEFLKDHRTVEKQQSLIENQQATIAQLQSAVAKHETIAAQQQKILRSKLAEQEEQIAALASGLHSMSARLQVSKPAAPIAVNP